MSQPPRMIGGPSELVACVATVVRMQGATLGYADLLCDCGAAFSLHVSASGFRHVDVLPAQYIALVGALALWGFTGARVEERPSAPLEEARTELQAGRAVAVAGCFPEAPWRAAVVAHVGVDGLWTLVDVSGRLHRAAPRAAVIVIPGRLQRPTCPCISERLALWAAAYRDAQDTVAAGWRNWLALLARAEAPSDTEIAAHEYLYEVLLDARVHAAAVVADAAEQEEGVRSDWLSVAAARLERLATHLEGRRPPLYSPQMTDEMSTLDGRRRLAAFVAEAAELDLSAREALTSALMSEYPPDASH